MNIFKSLGFLLVLTFTSSPVNASDSLDPEERRPLIKNHLGLVIQDSEDLKQKLESEGTEVFNLLTPYVKKGGQIIFIGGRETLAIIAGLCAAGTVFYCVTPLALPILEKGAVYAFCTANTTPFQYSIITVTAQSIVRFVVPSSLAYVGGRVGESVTRTSVNVLAKASKITAKGLVYLGLTSATLIQKALKKPDSSLDEDDFFLIESEQPPLVQPRPRLLDLRGHVEPR